MSLIRTKIEELRISSVDAAQEVQEAVDTHSGDILNPHSVTKAQVGLSNVDNTSDVNKPVSTAAQIALDLKANQSTTYTKTETDSKIVELAPTPDLSPYYTKTETDNAIAGLVDSAPTALNTLNELASALGDDVNFSTTVATNIGTVSSNLSSHSSNTSNPHNVTKTQVGLGSVDNTSDASKPVSTAQQTALDLKANASSFTNVENKSSATIRSEITSGNVTTALGFTPYNSTNPNGYLSSVAGSLLTGTSLASGIVSSSLTSVGTLSSLRSNGFINLGTNTFAKSSYGNGDLALDNGSNDTPGLLLYYANNKNWGIDSWNNGTSNVLRFVSDLNETGGAIRATLDNTGKFTAGSFAGDGSQLTNIVNASLANNTITSAKMAISGFFKTQFAERSTNHSLAGDSGWVDHLSMTITVGQTCCAVFTYISSSSFESGPVQGFARILVDGNLIGRNSCVAKQSTANHAGSGTVMWDYQNLPAGNHTITVQLRNNQGGSTWTTPYFNDGGTSNILGAMFYA